MFDLRQAEITVMQFTGHSLPVRQSMSVPWEFFSLSHFISQFPPTRFPVITAIRMCHLLPVHHLGMAFLAGSKGQNITSSSYIYIYIYMCVCVCVCVCVKQVIIITIPTIVTSRNIKRKKENNNFFADLTNTRRKFN